MFTGIIEEEGTISSIQKEGQSVRHTIHANIILEDMKIGDSIAVNGICLTVTSFSHEDFTADVMHETLSRTSLSTLENGSKVNLERAMQMNGRFGGHIVTGHIDGVGTITKIQRDSIAIWFTIKTTPNIMRYIVEKGAIAIDGISLTVAKLSQKDFSVSVIPHTIEHTILASKALNETVNLENDYLGKYVEKYVEKLMVPNQKQTSTITREFITKYGY